MAQAIIRITAFRKVNQARQNFHAASYRAKSTLVSAGSPPILMIVANVATPVAKIPAKIMPVVSDFARVGPNLSSIGTQLLS